MPHGNDLVENASVPENPTATVGDVTNNFHMLIVVEMVGENGKHIT
jgi:hypothetical protein